MPTSDSAVSVPRSMSASTRLPSRLASHRLEARTATRQVTLGDDGESGPNEPEH